MAYYDALIAKWPSVTGTDAAAKLVALNAERVAVLPQPVPIEALTTYLWSNGLMLPIMAAAKAGTSNGAVAAMALINDRTIRAVDMSLPIAGLLLADMVSNALLTQAQSDALNALANTALPWWQANGYDRPIGYGDLALSGISGAMWHYSVVATSGPNNIGATTATVEFWNDAAPDSKVALSVTSISLSDADIAAWAFRVARDLAARAATQITTGTAQPVSA